MNETDIIKGKNILVLTHVIVQLPHQRLSVVDKMPSICRGNLIDKRTGH